MNNMNNQLEQIEAKFKPIKLNVRYFADFDSFFSLTEQEREDITFFYLVAPIDSLLQLTEDKINMLRGDHIMVNCYGLKTFVAPIAINMFETREHAMKAQIQFGRNI